MNGTKKAPGVSQAPTEIDSRGENRRKPVRVSRRVQARDNIAEVLGAAVLKVMIQTRPRLVDALRDLIRKGAGDRQILRHAARAGANAELLGLIAHALDALRAEPLAPDLCSACAGKERGQ